MFALPPSFTLAHVRTNAHIPFLSFCPSYLDLYQPGGSGPLPVSLMGTLLNREGRKGQRLKPTLLSLFTHTYTHTHIVSHMVYHTARNVLSNDYIRLLQIGSILQFLREHFLTIWRKLDGMFLISFGFCREKRSKLTFQLCAQGIAERKQRCATGLPLSTRWLFVRGEKALLRRSPWKWIQRDLDLRWLTARHHGKVLTFCAWRETSICKTIHLALT